MKKEISWKTKMHNMRQSQARRAAKIKREEAKYLASR